MPGCVLDACWGARTTAPLHSVGGHPGDRPELRVCELGAPGGSGCRRVRACLGAASGDRCHDRLRGYDRAQRRHPGCSWAGAPIPACRHRTSSRASWPHPASMVPGRSRWVCSCCCASGWACGPFVAARHAGAERWPWSCGIAALFLGAIGWAGGTLEGLPLFVQLVSLSAVSGGSLAAVILAHWYLVTPRISEQPLVLTTRLLMVALEPPAAAVPRLAGGRLSIGAAVRSPDRPPGAVRMAASAGGHPVPAAAVLRWPGRPRRPVPWSPRPGCCISSWRWSWRRPSWVLGWRSPSASSSDRGYPGPPVRDAAATAGLARPAHRTPGRGHHRRCVADAGHDLPRAVHGRDQHPVRPQRCLRRPYRALDRRRRAGPHPARWRGCRRCAIGVSSCGPSPFPEALIGELRHAVSSAADGAVVLFLGQTRETAGTPAPGQEAAAASLAGGGSASRVRGIRVHGAVGPGCHRGRDRGPLRGPAAGHPASHGEVPLETASVIVVIAAEHRGAAFDACRYAIDELKARAPIWKQERFADGGVWVG